MKKIRLLFTGVGRRVELIQAFRQAAITLDKDLTIYGEDISDTAPALAYCDRRIWLCPIKDKNYIDELLRKSIEEKIDLIIPTIDTNLMLLAENRVDFEKNGIKVLISDPDKVALCRDKNDTFQFFIDCGLKAPLPVNDWREYKGGYPAFIKPKDGSSSIDAYKIENEQELELYAGQVPDYIIQPFIEGKEYTIDIFCDWKGNSVSIVPRERLQVRSGEVLKTRIKLDSCMMEEAEKLCRAFKPCGPITVQLIRDKDGVDWFIEINPRFGGGAPLSMKAGANSAEGILKLLCGEPPVNCKAIEDGAVYSRFDQSVCIGTGRQKVKGVIFDLDDTLYSEKEYVRSGFRAVAQYLGGRYEDRLWEFFRNGKQPFDELLKTMGRENDLDAVVAVYRSHKPDIHLYDGVDGVLKELKYQGYKIGLITDGRPEGQKNKIEALGLEELMDDIIITDELGGVQFRKPCDIGFRIIQNRWRISTNEIIYIGDNVFKDFQAPIQLGMGSILFDNDNGLYRNMAKYGRVITSIGEILGLI